jgi:hypothetical protein
MCWLSGDAGPSDMILKRSSRGRIPILLQYAIEDAWGAANANLTVCEWMGVLGEAKSTIGVTTRDDHPSAQLISSSLARNDPETTVQKRKKG